MSEESLPELTKAPIPPQTHVLRFDERLAKGKALRKIALRKAQAEWKPPADRPDPVDMLIENSKGRVEELIPIRYGRMMVSPFTFYRGAAAIMAYDLAYPPPVCRAGRCDCADELWRFATAERKVIFDPTTSTKPPCPQVDVKRLTAARCRALEWVRSGRLP
jgi:hypothetical protein